MILVNGFKSEYLRNVFTLISGTVLAQAIPMLATPVLTRLYSPEAFGIFGFCLSIAAILSIAGTGKYDTAIMQPDDDLEARQLFQIALFLGGVFSLVITLVVTTYSAYLSQFIIKPEVGVYLLYVPAVVFLMICSNAFTLLLNREKRFKQISFSRILHSVSVALISIGLGILSVGTYGLLLGSVIGYFLTVIIFSLRYRRQFPKIDLIKFHELMVRFANYPLYAVPSGICNSVAQYLPVLVFVQIFGAAASGYYFLVERVMLAPISTIGTSFGSVFRQRAQQDWMNYGNYRSVYLGTLRKLTFIGLPVFFIFALVAPDLFGFAFGTEWATAGEYARLLAPFFFFKFVASPLQSSFYISDKLKVDFIGQLVYLVLVSGSICIGYTLSSIETAICLISGSGCLFYIFSLCFTYKLSSHDRTEVL